MSLVLRHKPEAIGLTLDPHGWATVKDLVKCLAAHGLPLTRAELDVVVGENDKKRFAYNSSKTKIRASQGHSIDIDLELEPLLPPAELFHGTATTSVASILASGLQSRSRQHVHLSLDIETATRVGSRHGRPVVLTVDAAAMHGDGYKFYRSANEVWLTDEIPAGYLAVNW